MGSLNFQMLGAPWPISSKQNQKWYWTCGQWLFSYECQMGLNILYISSGRGSERALSDENTDMEILGFGEVLLRKGFDG